MWELTLKWLPLFGGIGGGILLLSWLIGGIYCSITQIFGYSSERVFGTVSIPGSLPKALVSGSIFSVAGGFLWVTLRYAENLHERTILWGIMLSVIVGGVCGGLGITEILQKVLRRIPCTVKKETTGWSRQHKIIGFVGGLTGGLTVGTLCGEMSGLFSGLIYGITSGLLGSFIGGMWAAHTFEGSSLGGGLLFGWLGGVSILVVFWGIDKLGIGWFLAGGTLLGGIAIFSYPGEMIESIASSIFTPIVSYLRFNTILCNRCLRYTSPLKSQYVMGKRYCEHCRMNVEFTKEPGLVVVTFGNISQFPCGAMTLGKRVFFLADPDLQQKKYPIEVSIVWIETRTCDRRLLEYFITYMVNYPPKQGMQSVQIFYEGELDNLGANFKNTLHNNFKLLKQIA